MSLPKEFERVQIPLEDILSATNSFAAENLIRHGGFGSVYKGQFSSLYEKLTTDEVVVRRLDKKYVQGDNVRYWTEILMLLNLKHKNLVTIVGFCIENGERIIVCKYEARGSLEKYLSSPMLTWIQRLEICVGVARALNHIHNDVGQKYSVIHGNIKSSTILLDENWESKLSRFDVSTKLVTGGNRLLLANLCGLLGDEDQVRTKTSSGTHKSDVFSFGVLLFEVLCGRETDYKFSVPSAISHYEKNKLDVIIDTDIWKQMDPQSFKVFSKTAYYCLKEQQIQRPNMDKVVQRLEKALELQNTRNNPETVGVKRTPFNHWEGKSLEHLKIRLSDINLATDNFAKTYFIGSGGYAMVYKAKLEHFDSNNFLDIEGTNKDEIPKIINTVAIKRIFNTEDRRGEQGFITEIKMLTSCKHPNIVSLLGFCDEGDSMILVYEYVSNGSLDAYLGNIDNMDTFTWAERIKICLDIAHGLHYLHSKTKEKQKIVHRDIKSADILLDNKWKAKIADFGLSKFGPANQNGSTLNTLNIAGTSVYIDPEYVHTGKLKKESDIYSFGVVLFEIFCGKLAYDKMFITENDKGIAPIARGHFKEGTIMKMIDPKLMEDNDEIMFTLNKGPDQQSLDTFLAIANQCLHESQADRPKMEVIIEELKKALQFQENRKDMFKYPLEEIQMATGYFNDKNCISHGKDWRLYKGKASKFVAKRFDTRLDHGLDISFKTELEILFKYKHENIIGLVGYCQEMGEKIILYNDTFNGSLDRYLNDINLSWIKRLEICINVVSGLHFLHEGTETKDIMIHRDIKCSSILLDSDWKAKLAHFGLSFASTKTNIEENRKPAYIRSPNYSDISSIESRLSAEESDIYSFGEVLFQILGGSLASTFPNIEGKDTYTGISIGFKSFGRMYKSVDSEIYYSNSITPTTQDEKVFEGIRKQIVPQSLATFTRIAHQCLSHDVEARPSAFAVKRELKKALELQEDYEIWEPKLPKDYEEIIKMSKTPAIYSTINKKDMYDMFSKGVLLREGNMLFSLGTNGERNEMISSTMFQYVDRRSFKWRSIRKSRFSKVAKMLDISNLKIQIEIKTQLLSPGVIYGVHLVFKFCDPRKHSSKPIYMNLNYKKGSETLHSYFATWRDEEWMTIELNRFLNHEKETKFDVILESFSRYYCGRGAIYIEGVEFRPIFHEKHEEVETSKQNKDPVHQLLVAEEKCYMLPAKMVLYESSDVKGYNWISLGDSRLTEVAELLSQQIFRIKCKIETQKLSLDTNYACFLVFKLSEKCRGLQCPVKVRDVLLRKNKETKLLYFRTPNTVNLHGIKRVPKQRKDGWMEVVVYEFKSSNDLKDDHFPMSLKLRCYEGTMSGLIVCGMEIRPE